MVSSAGANGSISISIPAPAPPPPPPPESPLLNLDDYSLLSLFDRLNLDDLINLAGISRRIDDIIATHYLTAKFHLHKTALPIKYVNGRHYIYDTAHKTYVDGLDGIDRFLRYFGEVIQAIELSGAPANDTDNGLRALGKVIERHCRHTLSAVVFRQSADAVVNYWRAPFDQVQRVNITIEHDMSNLTKVLPNIRKMHVTLLRDRAYDAFYLAHLTQLHYEELAFLSNRTFLKSLFHANPHLKRFHTKITLDADFLGFMATHLRELEELDIISFTRDFMDNVDRVQIQFASVKRLAITSYRYDTSLYNPVPLAFDRLESFELVIAQLSPEMLKFIVRNKCLQHLSLAFTSLPGAVLKELIDGLPALATLTIRWTREMTTNELIEALVVGGGSASLKAIAINPNQDVDIRPFLKAIPLQWHVAGGNAEQLSERMELKRIGA